MHVVVVILAYYVAIALSSLVVVNKHSPIVHNFSVLQNQDSNSLLEVEHKEFEQL